MVKDPSLIYREVYRFLKLPYPNSRTTILSNLFFNTLTWRTLPGSHSYNHRVHLKVVHKLIVQLVYWVHQLQSVEEGSGVTQLLEYLLQGSIVVTSDTYGVIV